MPLDVVPDAGATSDRLTVTLPAALPAGIATAEVVVTRTTRRVDEQRGSVRRRADDHGHAAGPGRATVHADRRRDARASRPPAARPHLRRAAGRRGHRVRRDRDLRRRRAGRPATVHGPRFASTASTACRCPRPRPANRSTSPRSIRRSRWSSRERRDRTRDAPSRLRPRMGGAQRRAPRGRAGLVRARSSPVAARGRGAAARSRRRGPVTPSPPRRRGRFRRAAPPAPAARSVDADRPDRSRPRTRGRGGTRRGQSRRARAGRPASRPSSCSPSASGLTTFERNVVLLCVGAELDTRIGPLCGRAQGDAGRSFPTFALALVALRRRARGKPSPPTARCGTRVSSRSRSRWARRS